MINHFKRLVSSLAREYMKLKTDAYIISYPSSGRNWLRILIGKALCIKFNLPDRYMFDTYKITSKCGVLRTKLTHDYSSINDGYKYDELLTDKTGYKDKKVLFLARNIKDVLVSSYFQASKRVGRYNGNISDFIRSERYGVMKIITFYNIWHKNMHIPKEFLLISYEDLQEDPERFLSLTFKFLGLDSVEDTIIKRAIKFADFNNMRELEKANFFRRESISPGNTDDDESYKVRRGIVGGYKSYLNEADIDYINLVVEESGCNFGQ